MAKDLGFFGLVWAILILAFSVFMLGATNGAQYSALAGRGDSDQIQPMKEWPTWWILRTYLQSLGQVHPSLSTSAVLEEVPFLHSGMISGLSAMEDHYK